MTELTVEGERLIFREFVIQSKGGVSYHEINTTDISEEEFQASIEAIAQVVASHTNGPVTVRKIGEVIYSTEDKE